MPSPRPSPTSMFEPLRTPTSLYHVRLPRRTETPAPKKRYDDAEDAREIARIHETLSGRAAAEEWVKTPMDDSAWIEQPLPETYQKELKSVKTQLATLEKKLAAYGDDVYDLTHDLEQPKPSLRERVRRFLLRSTGAPPDPGSFDDLLAQWKSLDTHRESLEENLEIAKQVAASHID